MCVFHLVFLPVCTTGADVRDQPPFRAAAQKPLPGWLGPCWLGGDYLGGLVIKKEINSDRSHPVLCHYAIFSTTPLLLSCISWAGHQRAAADADVHSAIQCTLFVGDMVGREAGREDIWQITTNIPFLHQAEGQAKKTSRRSKQMQTMILRGRLLFVRIKHFSNKDGE